MGVPPPPPRQGAPASVDNRGHVNTPSLKGLEVISMAFLSLKLILKAFRASTLSIYATKVAISPAEPTL